jgi:hypothetical protein
LSTTNPRWTDPVSNTSLRGERPATNPWHGIHVTLHKHLPGFLKCDLSTGN